MADELQAPAPPPSNPMSPWMMPLMTVLTGAFSYGAKTAAGQGLMLAAQRKQMGNNLAAQQLDVNAGQQQAVGSYAAAEEARKGELALSRTRALVAMQGGSGRDPSTLAIEARLNAEAGYRAAMAIYNSNEAARGMRLQADSQRFMGEATMQDAQYAKKQSDLAGYASLVKTGITALAPKTMAMKYAEPDTA